MSMRSTTTRVALLSSIAAAAFAGVSCSAFAQDSAAWQGVWIAEGLTPDISGFPPPGARWYKFLDFEAPWNEEGRKRFEATMRSGSDRKANGWGFPMMMDAGAPFEVIVAPHKTLIINVYRDVRHIYTDGRDHPPQDERWPTTWGDSIGHWEGDTLVVDTVSVRNPPLYFFSAPPLSEQAHYVERLRKVGPDRIDSVMTIEDPVTLAEPWVVNLTYVRAEGTDRLLNDDYANDRSEVDGDFFTIVPPKR
jgi:hypothetical protein